MKSLSRIYNLDAIRGVAVLGILYMNIYFFASPFYGYAEQPSYNNLDHSINLLSSLFFETRFISLFSLLFGAGLLIQFQRLQQNGHDAYSLTSARLKWLILFGALHALFIWSGDILLTYGVCGFLALNYHQDSPQQLFKKALQFVGIGLICTYLWFVLLGNETIVRDSAEFTEQISMWTSCYPEQVLVQLLAIGMLVFAIPFGALWYLSGLMLLGMALYKKGIFCNGLPMRWLALCVSASLICFGFDIVLQQSTTPIFYQFAEIATITGGAFTALVYLHFIIKVCQNSPNRLSVLQKVGRLAFSLYILQSLIGIIVFRYWMPEWTLEFERIDYFILAAFGSVLQLLLAQVYFMFFEQGPLEKLWRYLAFQRTEKN